MSRRYKIGILGASGRMGKKLQSLVLDSEVSQNDFQLVFAASGPNDPRFNQIESAGMDILIDFSAVPSSLKVAKLCAKLKIPMLICTTGFDAKQIGQLTRDLKNVPWALVPNTSLGVYALKRVTRLLSTLLPSDFHFEIVEMHHAEKKDAPSGTAKLLADDIKTLRKTPNLPVHSIRGGTEVGEHRVIALGPDERIEFVHRAQDRQLFAHGALKLAKALLARKAKRSGAPYSADELFEG